MQYNIAHQMTQYCLPVCVHRSPPSVDITDQLNIINTIDCRYPIINKSLTTFYVILTTVCKLLLRPH